MRILKSAAFAVMIAAVLLNGACGTGEPADPPRTTAPRTTAPATSAPPTTATPRPSQTLDGHPSTRTSSPAPKPSRTTVTPAARQTTPAPQPRAVYYANCAAVRRAGEAPLRRGEPGYRSGLDRDGDGTACDTTS